jgi:5-methylcytosine-specific restriction endonuclease McrBC regulatory subunit McrC
MINIYTVDNYIDLPIDTVRTKKEREELRKTKSNYAFSDKNINIKQDLNITLEDFKSENIQILNFFDSKDDKKDNERLIISIKKEDDKYIAKTGNFIGKFVWDKNLKIEINSRFSDEFLKRMLNFANDVYLDDIDVAGDITDNLDFSRFVIFYMFVQKLEKAFLLGLPKEYTTIKHHDMKVRGKVDIHRLIKHDIPFRGKISSVSREQKEVQEIIDILYKAVTVINKSKFSVKNIAHIAAHLKQHKNHTLITNETFAKAFNAKALRNPIFTPYKSVLDYAKMIIKLDGLESKVRAEKRTFGFVIDVSELFELYLVKLLRLHFDKEWEVRHEDELIVYDGLFYGRRMFPDIVMKHKTSNQLLVFDAKYKRMHFNKGIGEGGYGDLDRNDFFQIHTYISYYKNKGYDVLVGGLLYPMETEYDDSKCVSTHWLGDGTTKFIVDGIEVSGLDSFETVRSVEMRFIARIRNLMQTKDTKRDSE